MRFLLVEDDTMIGESLCLALKSEGYAVDWVQDGETACEALRDELYDLVLLDWGIPKKSGLEVLQDLRNRRVQLPVLVLTARDAVSDRVLGLDAGADDYLVKPFALAELEARIRALLRRRGGRGEPLLSSGAITLDPSTREISHHQKSSLLTAREFALMLALMEKPGAVWTRTQLEERLYGWNEEVASNAIEVHVHLLRKKLGQGVIRTVRGVGYSVDK